MWKIRWFRMKYEILRAQSLEIKASTFQLRSLKTLVCLKSGTVYKSGGGVWDVSLFSGTSGWKFVFQNIVFYSSLSKMTLVIPAFFSRHLSTGFQGRVCGGSGRCGFSRYFSYECFQQKEKNVTQNSHGLPRWMFPAEKRTAWWLNYSWKRERCRFKIPQAKEDTEFSWWIPSVPVFILQSSTDTNVTTYNLISSG